MHAAIAVAFLLLAAQWTCRAAMLFGNDSDLGGSSSHADGYLLGTRISITQAATLFGAGIIFRTQGYQANVGLYDTDAAGMPAHLVATTGPFAVQTNGPVEIPFTTHPKVSPGDYWFMAVYDHEASVGFTTSTTNLVAYISFDFASTLPTEFGPPIIYPGQDFNYYVTTDVAPMLVIQSQPESQTAFLGTTVLFSVVAVGYPSPEYQWRFNETELAGATNSSLQLTAISTNQAGDYTVVVSNSFNTVTSVVARLTVVDAAPRPTAQPQSRTVFSGRDVTFAVSAEGSLPLFYQWQFNEMDILGATNAILTLAAVTTNQAGTYSVIVSNALNSVISANAVLTVLETPPNETFQVLDLSSDGVNTIDHDLVTGDDRGGIALSSNRVFYTGDDSTGAFNREDLLDGQSLGRRYDSLVSDLKTETVYVLGHDDLPIAEPGGVVTSLLELDGQTGQPTGRRIDLSEEIDLPSGSGIFAGFGCVVVHTGARVYTIFVPSGIVLDEGAMSMPNHAWTENWACWGVAEYFDGAVWLDYVQDSQTIVRSRVPDGLITVVGSFTDLSDMACFTVCPRLGRWYFHHEGTSQFGGREETIGFADAAFSYVQEPAAPQIYSQPSDQTVMVGHEVRLTVRATGYPLFYQWRLNGTDIAGATNATLTLPAVTTNQRGPYSVIVSNALGAIESRVATLTVIQPAGLVGYFTDFSTGSSALETPILRAGFAPVQITDLPAFNLEDIDLLMINESENDGPSEALQEELPAIEAWVRAGGRLIVHDRYVGAVDDTALPNPFLLGASNTLAVRSFTHEADLDVIGFPKTLVTDGPFGRITSATLDGGDSSDHGYVGADTLPVSGVAILSAGPGPERVAAFSYRLGNGFIYYSTIPLDYYLGGGESLSAVMQEVYTPNLLVYVASLSSETRPEIRLVPVPGGCRLDWTFGQLEAADHVTGPYLPVSTPGRSCLVPLPSPSQFFRTRLP
jgi:hypothetical protein